MTFVGTIDVSIVVANTLNFVTSHIIFYVRYCTWCDIAHGTVLFDVETTLLWEDEDDLKRTNR